MLAEITEHTAASPRGSHRAAGGVVTVLVPAHNESAGITETLTR